MAESTKRFSNTFFAIAFVAHLRRDESDFFFSNTKTAALHSVFFHDSTLRKAKSKVGHKNLDNY